MTGFTDHARLTWSRPVLRPEVVAAWCDDIARRTRARESLRSALRAATTQDATLHVSIEPILRALDRGATIPVALDRVAGPTTRGDRRRPVAGLDHLALACSVIAVAASIGGAPSSPLDRVAAALRLRGVDRDDRATQTAQARMSAHVLTVVPMLMLALLSIADADVRDAVIRPAGATCVVVGLLLNLLGVVVDASYRKRAAMNLLITALVAIDVAAFGAALRAATRSRRTRCPSADDDDDRDDDRDAAARAASPIQPERHDSQRPWRRHAASWATIAGCALGGVALGGPFLGLVGVGAVAVTRGVRRVARQRQARQRIERSTPDAVELLVLLIHAGLTPVHAIREMTTLAPSATRGGFAAVVRRLERGEAFSDTLAALPQHLGPSMVGLADLMASADRNGSPLVPMLESLAHEARASRQRQHEAAARRLPVRLSFPLVVCTLPSFVLLAIAPAVIAALSSLSLSV